MSSPTPCACSGTRACGSGTSTNGAGHNYRLTDVQAAIAIPQLATLAACNARRQANAARLDAGLTGIPGLITPTVVPGNTHVFHQYTVRVTEAAQLHRDALARGSERAGSRPASTIPGSCTTTTATVGTRR